VDSYANAASAAALQLQPTRDLIGRLPAHLAAAKESALAVQNYAAATDGSSCGITSVIKSSSVRLDSSKVMSPVGNMKQM